MTFEHRPISIILALVALTFLPAKGDVYYVAPKITDCSFTKSCNTLNYYANSTTQQLSDSVFYFIPGTHRLQQTWVIDNTSNLTLSGRLPNSKRDEEVIVECSANPWPTSNSYYGIRVINGTSITVKSMEICYCQQGTDGVWNLSSALFFAFTSNLELSNLTIVFSNRSGIQLINCSNFSFTDSVVTNSNGAGIFIGGVSSGKLTSIQVLNNSVGILVEDQSLNLTSVQLDRIYASHNWLDFKFYHCSADITLSNSLSIHSGGLIANQSCLFSGTYAIQFQKCSFSNLRNGAIIHVNQADHVEIKVISCSFTGSSGPWYIGLYILMMPSLATPRNKTVCFIQNVRMENIHTMYQSTVSVLSLFSIRRVAIINVSILNNGHGGLALYDSVAEFHGTNTFRNNSGIYGGGMALYENSYIFVESNASLKFINNKAAKFGGGIFISEKEWSWQWIKNCFIQLADESSQISFQGNKAKHTGSDFYGGNIDQVCLQKECYSYLADVLGFSTDKQCGRTDVSSEATKLMFCDDHCIDNITMEKSVSKYPGTKVSISIAAVGQLYGLTQANVLLEYDEEVFDHVKEDESEYIHASDFIVSTCTNISRDIRVKRTNTKGNITLTVSNNFIPPHINQPITLVVNLLPCPAGFNFSKENKACVCSDVIKDYAECDITSKNISPRDSIWISPTSESIMIFEACPFDYCNIHPFSVDNPDGQCSYNRSGILCGGCIEGYSLSLGSNQCLDCAHQVWKLPVILLGSALAGIGLVTVLIGLNLTVSTGTINGLLFFINVVKIYQSLFFGNYHCSVLQYLLSWLNLDLAITTCLYEGLNACQKVGLQFAFPLYLLLLVLLIVAACRCGQWVVLRSSPWVVKISDKTALLLGSKIIPVLATLLLFSYTKLIRTIIMIYQKADIEVYASNTSISDCGKTSRWYVNGNVEYLGGCHIVLFCVGTGIIVPLISLFTAFLLLFPLMERYLPYFKCWGSWHMRLKPWYDAYGGPYKDKYRFWTGLLLLVRCVLVLVVTVDNDPNVVSSILVWLCQILILLVALLQVYKSFFLNVLEIVYLSSILAMVSLSAAPQNSVQLSLLLSISFFLLIAIVLLHTGQRLKSSRLAMFLQRPIMDKKAGINEQVHSVNRSKDAGNINVTVTTIRIANFDQLREPLIEDSN